MKNIGDPKALFRSTAYYYARYRMPYPAELLNLVRARFRLDGTGALLDAGCGTGQLAMALSGSFSRVVAVDASPEMIAEAKQHALKSAHRSIEFEVSQAEEFAAPPGSFRLVTFGQSLHWMDIEATLRKCRTLLAPGGGISIIGSRSIWGGESEWELAVVETVKRWLGEARRAGAGSFGNPDRPFEVALADAGFTEIESGTVQASFELDIPAITGHLYSTSYCNREMLGHRAGEFEADLERTLLALEPSGRFTWSPPFNYLFASSP